MPFMRRIAFADDLRRIRARELAPAKLWPKRPVCGHAAAGGVDTRR